MTLFSNKQAKHKLPDMEERNAKNVKISDIADESGGFVGCR